MYFKSRWMYSLLGIILLTISVLGLYVCNQYVLLDAPVKQIQLTFNNDITPKGLPTVYVSGKTEEKLNFKKAYKFKKVKDSTYAITVDDTLQLRKFRCYFEYPGEKVILYNINLVGLNNSKPLNLNDIKEFVSIKETKVEDCLILNIKSTNGFFTNPKRFLYTTDFAKVYQLIIPLLCIVMLIGFFVLNLKKIDLKTLSIPEVSLAILILSIFLPAPIYNIALILTAILNVKKISFKAIMANKINLLFIGFFMLYLLNNLFISEESYTNLRTIERFVPFLILSIVIPPIATKKFLGLFPLSAVAIGLGLLMTSIFDVYVHQNLDFISFGGFTKYLHPVYYSYLLFFSIIYIQFCYFGKLKYLYIFMLFCFLIFSGSKMVLVFSLLVMLLSFIKNFKIFWVIVPIVLIVFLFSPLKQRFSEVLNQNDLEILTEKHIDNENDHRINGLTFRLILWREAVATMHGMDYVIGKGVTKKTNLLLENRLDNLGLLKHRKFNPHNQYVDTFWRTGIIGLLLLILLPLYSLAIGVKRKDKLIILFSLFMIAVMFTESIFGRVNGIYFFTTVILILINSSKLHENSNIRNERNTK